MAEDQQLEQTVRQITELLARRRLNSAREMLNSTLPGNPSHVGLLELAAELEWLDDDNYEAKLAVDRILVEAPESYTGRYVLTQIQRESEEFADAEATVLGLLQDYPEDSQLYAVYAQIMLETFNVDKAEQLATEALARDPTCLQAMAVHAECGFITQPDQQQLARLRRILEEHPDQVRTTILMVQRLGDKGKTSEAYELARTLAASQPDNPHIVAMADELRYASHWSLKPLWPMQKWGWGASIAIWIAAMLFFRSSFLPEYRLPIAIALGSYVVYSWLWPPLLKRILGVK